MLKRARCLSFLDSGVCMLKACVGLSLLVVLVSKHQVISAELRDPTRPPFASNKTASVEADDNEKSMSVRPVLQQIIHVGDKKTAIISANSYQVGDEGPDFKVLSIRSQEVEIRVGDKREILSLKSDTLTITESSGVQP